MPTKTKKAPAQDPLFSIEHNIPMPASRVSTNHFPLHLMKVGDSFHVGTAFKPEWSVKQIHSTINYSIGVYKKQTPGRQFAARSLKDGVRVWRVK